MKILSETNNDIGGKTVTYRLYVDKQGRNVNIVVKYNKDGDAEVNRDALEILLKRAYNSDFTCEFGSGGTE